MKEKLICLLFGHKWIYSKKERLYHKSFPNGISTYTKRKCDHCNTIEKLEIYILKDNKGKNYRERIWYRIK